MIVDSSLRFVEGDAYAGHMILLVSYDCHMTDKSYDACQGPVMTVILGLKKCKVPRGSPESDGFDRVI